MKEIKFRAWHEAEKEMVYLNKIDYLGQTAIIDNYVGHDFAIWMQYIGLTDKNEKEIYEGDILQDETGLGVVKWVQEHCSFLVYVSDPAAYHSLESGDFKLYKSEVIGNVYENKNLFQERG